MPSSGEARKKWCNIWGAGWAVLVAVCLLKCDQAEPVAPTESELTVPSLTANYRYHGTDSGYVVLEWTPPDGRFDFYRIYRTAMVDSLGRPVISTLDASLQRNRISRDSTRFRDIPEPKRGLYFYGIRAVRLTVNQVPCAEGTCFDTVEIEGELSPRGGLVPCRVGVDVRFAINHGDVFTLSDVCTLVVYDPNHAVVGIRFSQLVGASGPSTSEGTPVPGDTFRQILDLQRAGLLPSSTVRTPDTGRVNFDRSDSTRPDSEVHPELGGDTVANDRRVAVYDSVRRLHRCVWTLLPGTGQKNVWAEVSYADGRRDTLYDNILTKPHKVDIVWRHQEDVRDTSEWVSAVGDSLQGRVKCKIFYTSRLQFSVKVYGDSTLDTVFEYWYLSSPKYFLVNRDYLSRRGWIMTQPITASLTGRGVRHSSEATYTVDLDPISETGRRTLRVLMSGRGGNIVEMLQNSPEENRRVVDSLVENDRPRGRKEFVLVTRFKERFFKGFFVNLSSYVDTTQVVRTHRDAFPPAVRFDYSVKNPQHLNNGSVIVGPFGFALDSASSLSDSGLAKITGIELLVAKLPTDFVWNDSTSPVRISLDSALTFSHEIFVYPLEKPESLVREVRWENIDPRRWTSGYYLIGVVAQDDKGNRGFGWAYDLTRKPPLTNPWRVFIRTNY